jgi:hypothetical protein
MGLILLFGKYEPAKTHLTQGEIDGGYAVRFKDICLALSFSTFQAESPRASQVPQNPAPRVTTLAKDLPGNSEGLPWQND